MERSILWPFFNVHHTRKLAGLFFVSHKSQGLCVLRLHPTLWHSLHGLLPAQLQGLKNSERRFSLADSYHASFKQWCSRIGSKTTWRNKHLECQKTCCQIISSAKCFWLAENKGPSLENVIYNFRPIGSGTRIASDT